MTWLWILLAGAPWTAPPQTQIESILASSGSVAIADRLERVTRPFLGAPYVLSPLGEGSGRDPDPRVRFDAFDCTTFVETAIALVASRNLSEVPGLLDGVRYRGGAISFEARRHLIDSAWVPDLVAAGILEDVTEEIGGDRTVKDELEMTTTRWKKRRVARELELPPTAISTGKFKVAWIPLDQIESLEIPPGLIMNVVREDVPWAPTRISHQALILKDPKTGAMIVRQASPVGKRVKDEPVSKFVDRYLHPKVEKKWRPVGVSFFRLK